MNYSSFPPPRQFGLALHIGLVVVLGGLTAWSLYSLTQATVGLALVLYAVVAFLAFLPIPFLVYRIYALQRSGYVLDRDNLTLSWGLRVEQIPLSDIEWVRSISDMQEPVRLPWPSLPGSVVGVRAVRSLGIVEFLASDRRKLLLVATARRIFAISPSDPVRFAQTFQRAIEMGSLAPAPARSLYPSFVVARAWDQPLVRYLWLSGFLLNIGSLVWVSLLIPSLSRISLGFSAAVTPLEPVPGARLILLPLLSILFYITGWITGLFFFRREDQQPIAFILWTTSSISALLFLLALLFIITTPI